MNERNTQGMSLQNSSKLIQYYSSGNTIFYLNYIYIYICDTYLKLLKYKKIYKYTFLYISCIIIPEYAYFMCYIYVYIYIYILYITTFVKFHIFNHQRSCKVKLVENKCVPHITKMRKWFIYC
jgi:hypothetical protein